MTTRVKPLPKAAVDTPAPFTLVQAEAVKAIYLGQASEYQQRIENFFATRDSNARQAIISEATSRIS